MYLDSPFHCRCPEDYLGMRCEKSSRGSQNLASTNNKSLNAITVGILIAVTVLLLLLLVIAGAYFVVVRFRRLVTFKFFVHLEKFIRTKFL